MLTTCPCSAPARPAPGVPLLSPARPPLLCRGGCDLLGGAKLTGLQPLASTPGFQPEGFFWKIYPTTPVRVVFKTWPQSKAWPHCSAVPHGGGLYLALDSGRGCGSLEARGGTRRIPVPQRPGWVRQEASTALLECSAQVCTHTRVQTHARTHARALKHPHTHIKSSSGQACPRSMGPADKRVP